MTSIALLPAPRSVEFTLRAAFPPSGNELLRMHFRARKAAMEAIGWEVLAQISRQPGYASGRDPMRRCALEIAWASPAFYDWDGMFSGLKPVLDTLVRRSGRNPCGLGLIVDDSPRCIVSQPRITPIETGRGGDRWLRVLVTEVPGCPDEGTGARVKRRKKSAPGGGETPAGRFHQRPESEVSDE